MLPLDFVQIGVQILRADLMKSPGNGATQEALGRFNRVGVDVAVSDSFFLTMVDRFVPCIFVTGLGGGFAHRPREALRC